jgi:hypothetical protein
VEIPFIPISACYPPKNGLAELLKPVGSLVARSQATTEELMNGYSLVLAVAKCLSRSKLKAGLAGFNIWNFYTEPPYIKHQGGYA